MEVSGAQNIQCNADHRGGNRESGNMSVSDGVDFVLAEQRG